MTDEPKNGAAMQDKPAPLTQQQAMSMMIDNWIWPVVSTAITGIQIVLLQQHRFPVGAVIVSFSRLCGRAVGHALSLGNLADVLPMRGECVKAFTEAVRSVNVQPPPQAHGASTVMPAKH